MEMKEAKEVSQALSLKLWGLFSQGCGTRAQYLQDRVVNVSVKSTSCVVSTAWSTPAGGLALTH